MVGNQTTPQHTRTALRIHLLRRGLKVRDLAEQLGMHKVYIFQVLSGTRRGSPTRKRLIEECGIPASLLRFREGKPTRRGSKLQPMTPPASPIIGQIEVPSKEES